MNQRGDIVNIPTLRRWAAVEGIREQLLSGAYGELCAVRFAFSLPKIKHVSLLGVANALVDAGGFLAESAVDCLHVESWEIGAFILVQYVNGITAEIEINLALPDSMPGIYFVKTFCTEGLLTNQPITGYFNSSGTLFATDEKCALNEPGGDMKFHDDLEVALYRAEYYREPAAPDMGLKEYFHE